VRPLPHSSRITMTDKNPDLAAPGSRAPAHRRHQERLVMGSKGPMRSCPVRRQAVCADRSGLLRVDPLTYLRWVCIPAPGPG
jgi:hypothetical protein